MRLHHVIGLAVAMFANVALAGARDQLAAFTKDLKGLEGQFTQQVYDANGKRKEASSGHVALSAPRLFRWEYLKPFPQLIIADGKTVWVYDPDLRQVTKRPQGVEEQNSPLTALIDPAKLDKEFTVRELPDADGVQWLQLTPRDGNEASFQSARLGFTQQGLVRMRVVDALGQRTDISFQGWKRNPKFARGTFRYEPPKGVDVVGG